MVSLFAQEVISSLQKSFGGQSHCVPQADLELVMYLKQALNQLCDKGVPWICGTLPQLSEQLACAKVPSSRHHASHGV